MAGCRKLKVPPARKTVAVTDEVSRALLPGPPIMIGAVRLYRLTGAHWIAMNRLCPAIVSGETAPDAEQSLRALLIAATPDADVAALLETPAVDIDRRGIELASKIPMADMLNLPAAFVALLDEAFSTVLKPAGAEKKTGSAGSSPPPRPAARSTAGRSSTR